MPDADRTHGESSLTADEVRKVARLAKLTLTEGEIEVERQRLGEILRYARRLQALDLSGVEPMAHTGDHGAPLRGDEPGRTLAREAALRLAPDAADPFIRVPRTLEGGGGA